MHYTTMSKRGVPLMPCRPGTKMPGVKSYSSTGDFTGWAMTPAEVEAAKTTAFGFRASSLGMIVVDLDIKKGGDGINQFIAMMPEGDPMREMVKNNQFPAFTVTPSGGLHLFFKAETDELYKKVVPEKNVEIFHGSNYLLAPGSVVDGCAYIFHGDIDKAPPAPEWLIDLMTREKKFTADFLKDYTPSKFEFNPEFAFEYLQAKQARGEIAGTHDMLNRFGSWALHELKSIAAYERTVRFIESKLPELDTKHTMTECKRALRYLYTWQPSDAAIGSEPQTVEEKKLFKEEENEYKKALTEATIKMKVAEAVKDFCFSVFDSGFFYKDSPAAINHLSDKKFNDKFSDISKKTDTAHYARMHKLVEKYDRVVYAPENPSKEYSFGRDRVFNSYLPPVWEDMDEKRADALQQPYIKLLKQVIPDEDERREFQDMVAATLQNPGRKVGRAVLLFGETKGSGKTLLLSIVERLFGNRDIHGCIVNTFRADNSTIEEKYNGYLESICFLHIEEIYQNKDRTLMNKVKPWITAQVIPIRRMNMNQYNAPTHFNIFCSTNYPDALSFDDDDDRRWLVIKCREEKLPEEMREELVKIYRSDDRDFFSALYKTFTTQDISDFNWGDAIKTEAKTEMTEATKSIISRAVDMVSLLGALDYLNPAEADINKLQKREFLTGAEVRALVKQWDTAQEFKERYEADPDHFARYLKKHGFKKHPEKSQVIYADGNGKKSVRPWIHPEAYDRLSKLSKEDFSDYVKAYYSLIAAKTAEEARRAAF